MRTLILKTVALGALAAVAFTNTAPAAPGERDLSKLTLLGPNYPRVFFFRASEGLPRRADFNYDAWDAEYSRLMGIMGKCLDEEIPKTMANNPGVFSKFKQQHPEQAVLLHFNGNSRDPRFQAENYFPGHWVYRQATRITADVPAQAGESVIHVENARDFIVNGGRYKTSNDDIGLFGITADGKHDWNYCEQVQLLAVDEKAKTIKVKRGCYGTKPLAFKTGKSRAAAHAVEGPWGKQSNILWFYNFSTQCPKDANGKNCADLLVDDLGKWFGPGGALAAFDGLEFDVMFNETHGDTDGDGELDNGVINGLNQYGIGMVEFARKLRARFGDNRIIQGDGALGPGGIRSQRNWGLLNGIESEGFPNLNEWNMDDWSGGLNRHAFWQANARPPVFNYINHKWVEHAPGDLGEKAPPNVPLARHRMVFAAAQFTDAMLCYSFQPPKREQGKIGIWDELRCGTENKLGWLGKPEGEAVHLAAATPNLLADAKLATRIRGDVNAREQGGEVVISAKETSAKRLNFTVPDLAFKGGDLSVLVTMKGEPLTGYPREMARFTQLEMSGGQIGLSGKEPEETGMCVRGKKEEPIDKNTGGRVHFMPHYTIGNKSLAGYTIHPPFQGKIAGYVYWCKDVEMPAGAELRFSLGMAEKSPTRSDGVWFQVWAAELNGGKPGPFTKLFEKSTKAFAWIPCRVPLDKYAGKRVRLKFVADCGPNDNTVTDQGFWGDVKIANAGDPDSSDTPSKTYMTWLNDKPFTSAFYYRDIKSGKANLSFSFEGTEPVTIQKLAVYAHPDAMYRVFQHGLVLANPSHQPYTFDLDAISPGRKYRRFQGTEGQDPTVNNGQPASGKVTLGERDALFLVRVP